MSNYLRSFCSQNQQNPEGIYRCEKKGPTGSNSTTDREMKNKDTKTNRLTFLIAIVSILTFITAAYAYDGLDYYGCRISARDRVNSSGNKLTSIRDILSQDRANCHRFGKRDADDELDRYCQSAAGRKIFQTAKIRVSPALQRKIQGGGDVLISVFILDNNLIDIQPGLPNPNAG